MLFHCLESCVGKAVACVITYMARYSKYLGILTLATFSFTFSYSSSVLASDLVYTAASDRSLAIPLENKLVAGDIYIYLSQETDVFKVTFFIDDPDMLGRASRTDRRAPFDFVGGNTRNARALDTTSLTEGVHTITALIERSSSVVEVLNTSFTVANSVPQLLFTTGVLSFSGGEGGAVLSQTVNLASSDGSAVSYTISDNADWLDINPINGLTTDTLTVSVNTGTLPPGDYSALVIAQTSGYVIGRLDVVLTVTPTSGVKFLVHSPSSDRSNITPLEGETLLDDVYVLVSPELDIDRVTFYIDDPTQLGRPEYLDRNPPFDLAGGNSTTAMPFDTNTLSEGSHTLTAVVDLLSGTSLTLNASFIVDNLPQIEFSENILSFSVKQGEVVADQSVDLSTANNLSIDYTVTDDAAWLSVLPTQGITPETLITSVDITGLVPNTYSATIAAIATNGGYQDGALSVDLTVAEPNQFPLANAGLDQVLNEGDAVTLDGSASNDSDGIITSFAWLQIAGPVVTLANFNTSIASFTAPEVLIDTVLTFQLTVIDDSGASTSDFINVTVNNVNKLPIADAGLDQDINEGGQATLDGNTSSDPDGTIISYAWLQTAGPAALLVNANTAIVSFIVPDVTVDTLLSFELTVTDDLGGTATDSVDVTAINVNQLPVASAGVDQTVAEGISVTLDGSGSSDPDGTLVNFAWIQTAGPAAVVTNANASIATFIAPEVTIDSILSFQLTVTDDLGAISTDLVNVSVTNVNKLPVANAGVDQSVNETAAVTLNGSASSDPDGVISAYQWVQTAGPSVSLANTNTSIATFSAPAVTADTVFTFQLTVTDNETATANDFINVTVKNVNKIPLANAGLDQTVFNGDSVFLDGSASSDLDGVLINYAWTQIVGPAVTITNANTVIASFISPTVPVDTVLGFQLTVTDNDGGSTIDIINITVIAGNQPPVANAGGPYEGLIGVPVTFDGSGSNDPENDSLTYSWDFGDGSSGTGVSPNHTYVLTGTYSIRLTVNDGAEDSLVDMVDVVITANIAPYIDDLTAEPAIIPELGTSQLNIVAVDTDSGPSILTYTWQVPTGAGSLSNLNTENPVYTPPDVIGTQTFTLQVDVSDGASIVSQSIDITVYDVSTLITPGILPTNLTGINVLDGVYYVNSTVTVRKDATLIATPGTVIKFDFNTGLLVNGILIVRGSADAMVRFTSAQVQPALNDWNGITINGFSHYLDGLVDGVANINYAWVDYASAGIYFKYSASGEVHRSILTKNHIGIRALGGFCLPTQSCPAGFSSKPEYDTYPLITGNGIFNNYLYNYYASWYYSVVFPYRETALDARFNWWGTTDPDGIELYLSNPAYNASPPINYSGLLKSSPFPIPLEIEIVDPVGNTIVQGDSISVKGSFTPPDAIVTVNGVTAKTNGTQYIADVSLGQGSNIITATVSDKAGNTLSKTVNVTQSSESNIAVTVDNVFPLEQEPVAFTLTNNTANTMTKIEVDYEGDGVIDLTQTTNLVSPMTFIRVYSLADSYQAMFKVTDNTGATYIAYKSVQMRPVIPLSSIAFDRPLDGAVLDADKILISGTYAGPDDTSITVNGITAITTEDRFYINNFSLQSGLNTLTVVATTPDLQTVQKSIMVTSNAQTLVSLSASPETGPAPLDVTFTINNTTGKTLTNVELDFNGDGVIDVSNPIAPIIYTYANQGTYLVTLHAVDEVGVEYLADFTVVAELDVALVDSHLQGIFNAMLGKLGSGDITGALDYFEGGMKSTYEEIFNELALGNDLATMVSGLGTVVDGVIGKNWAEYVIVRNEGGQKTGFAVQFVYDERDNQWKIGGF